MLEAVDRGEFVEALVAAVVAEQGLSVRPNCRFFVVEVGVGVDDFSAFIAASWILPCEVLELGLDVAAMMPKDELGTQLLAHEFLGRGDPCGRPQALFKREHPQSTDQVKLTIELRLDVAMQLD